MNVLSHLSEEEILERFNSISQEYIELSQEISPKLIKLNKLDKEISVLREELERREEK